MIWIQETCVDEDRNMIIGESDVYESYIDSPGELFRSMRREYGGCTGKVYVERPDGGDIPVGWVFQRTEHYTDTHEPYLQSVWVTLHTAPDTVTRTPHYFQLGKVTNDD